MDRQEYLTYYTIAKRIHKRWKIISNIKFIQNFLFCVKPPLHKINGIFWWSGMVNDIALHVPTMHRQQYVSYLCNIVVMIFIIYNVAFICSGINEHSCRMLSKLCNKPTTKRLSLWVINGAVYDVRFPCGRSFPLAWYATELNRFLLDLFLIVYEYFIAFTRFATNLTRRWHLATIYYTI